MFIKEVIATAWLRPYNVLVYDDATIHQNGYNGDLSYFLWNSQGLENQPLNILLLPLPTWSLELNPIKLVWNKLVMRLKYGRLAVGETHEVANPAETVLNAIDFNLIRRTFRHCGYRCWLWLRSFKCWNKYYK